MWISLILGVATVVFLLSLLVSRKRADGRDIPGPPLLEGIVFFIRSSINNTLHLDLPKLADKYGPMMRIRLIVRDVVYINDMETFRTLTSDSKYSKLTNSRPPVFIGQYHFSPDLFFDDIKDTNVNKRKLFIKLLNFYGEGVQQFEDIMTETLKELCDSFKTKCTVTISSEIRNYIFNVMSMLLSGDGSSDVKEHGVIMRNFVETADKIFLFENEMYLQPFPFLRHVPGLRFKKLHCDMTKKKAELLNCFLKSPKPSTTGIVHELVNQEFLGPDKTIKLHDADIEGLVMDICIGGSLATGQTASSLFLMLVKRQDIQENIHDEIKRVIGNSQPHFSHRQQMPYTEAVLLEILRFVTPPPFFIPHLITEDFVFDGYHMPKGSFLIMNAFYNNHRADVWEDPYTFRPERYLDENGDLLDAIYPLRKKAATFGSGPRRCPGEAFAKARLFLLMVTVIKQFHLLPPEDGTELPSSDPREFETLSILGPPAYNCKIVPRSTQ